MAPAITVLYHLQEKFHLECKMLFYFGAADWKFELRKFEEALERMSIISQWNFRTKMHVRWALLPVYVASCPNSVNWMLWSQCNFPAWEDRSHYINKLQTTHCAGLYILSSMISVSLASSLAYLWASTSQQFNSIWIVSPHRFVCFPWIPSLVWQS